MKKIVLLTCLALSATGCAATTEPSVRAYLHERKAFEELGKGHLAAAEADLKLALRDNPKEPSSLKILSDRGIVRKGEKKVPGPGAGGKGAGFDGLKEKQEKSSEVEAERTQ